MTKTTQEFEDQLREELKKNGAYEWLKQHGGKPVEEMQGLTYDDLSEQGQELFLALAIQSFYKDNPEEAKAILEQGE